MDAFVIDAAHPCLPGHFPGQPIVPGVLILDRVLDAIEAGHGARAGLRLPNVKFVQPLLPGETAHIALDGAAPRWRFRVTRGDALIASGEIVDADAAESASR
jgi:3-hydroxyacyl-[acyl-carrier-protein] dehydratase